MYGVFPILLMLPAGSAFVQECFYIMDFVGRGEAYRPFLHLTSVNLQDTVSLVAGTGSKALY